MLVELSEATLAGIVERNRHRLEWVACYGLNPNRLACKVLLGFAGAWYLATNESAIPLEGNRILGTCRRIERNGKVIGLPVSQIAAGAATAVGAATDPDILIQLTAPASNGTQQVLWTQHTVLASDWIEVSASFRINTAYGGSGWHADVFAMYGNTAGTAVAIGEKLVKDAHGVEFGSVTGLVNLAAGTYRFGIGVDLYSDGTNNLDCRFLNATTRTTIIRR